MNRLTNEQLLQIFDGQFKRPTEAAIRAIVKELRTKFTLLAIKSPTRLRRVRTQENIAAVSASVNDDHQLSIRRRWQQLDLCYSTTWKILRQNLGVKPFKMQLAQELKPNDLTQRRIFGEWALGLRSTFYRKIVFSDESRFWLNGYVNK